MLKYHVAVCDDEKSDLDGIVQSVQQYDVHGDFYTKKKDGVFTVQVRLNCEN